MFLPKNHTPQVKFGVPSGQIKFGCFCRFSALLAVHSALEEKAIAEYHDIHLAVFNLYDIYPPQTSARHTQTPSRHCQTSSNTIQTPAYLACINITKWSLQKDFGVASELQLNCEMYTPPSINARIISVSWCSALPLAGTPPWS